MPAIDARPAEYVAVPKPTPEQMEALHGVLTTLEVDLRKATRNACRLNFNPEDAICPAEAFAVVCRLITDLQYAQPCPEPERFPLPPVVTLPAAKPAKAVAKPKTRKAFDFAALPPRAECGC